MKCAAFRCFFFTSVLLLFVVAVVENGSQEMHTLSALLVDAG